MGAMFSTRDFGELIEQGSKRLQFGEPSDIVARLSKLQAFLRWRYISYSKIVIGAGNRLATIFLAPFSYP